MRKWIAIWLASLVIVAGLASALTRAQAPQADAPVLSGSDIGFRVEGNKAGKALGMLMVRINGKWVEASMASKIGLTR